MDETKQPADPTLMSPEAKVELAKAMTLPPRDSKRKPVRPPLPKTPPRPGVNDICPCGSLREDGKPYKFKHCCGSAAGDLVYFVANGQDVLTNAEGRVLVFSSQSLAIQTAKVKRWYNGEVIPMAPHRFARFKTEVPYVMVTTKEFDVAPKEPPEEIPAEPPVETHQAITTLASIMGAAMGKPNET